MLEDFGTRDIKQFKKEYNRNVKDIKDQREKIEVIMYKYLNTRKSELINEGFEAVQRLLRLQKELCTLPTQTRDLTKKAYYDCFERQDLIWEALEEKSGTLRRDILEYFLSPLPSGLHPIPPHTSPSLYPCTQVCREG